MHGLPQSAPMASQDSMPLVNFFSDPTQLGTAPPAPRRLPRDPASAPRRLPRDPGDFSSLPMYCAPRIHPVPASSLMHEHNLPRRAHMASHGSPPVEVIPDSPQHGAANSAPPQSPRDPGIMGQGYYASILSHGNDNALDEILSWPEREQQTVPVETTPSSSKPSNKRSKNFCEEEAFQFLHCWPLLQRQPKWINLSSKKQKTATNSSLGPSMPPGADSAIPINLEKDNTAQNDHMKRPGGKKKAKGKSCLGKEDNLYKEAFDNFWEKKVEVEKEK